MEITIDDFNILTTEQAVFLGNKASKMDIEKTKELVNNCGLSKADIAWIAFPNENRIYSNNTLMHRIHGRVHLRNWEIIAIRAAIEKLVNGMIIV